MNDETSLVLDAVQLIDERRGFAELWRNYRKVRRYAREHALSPFVDLRAFRREIRRRIGVMRRLKLSVRSLKSFDFSRL